MIIHVLHGYISCIQKLKLVKTLLIDNTSPSPVPFTYDNTLFDFPASHNSLPVLPTTPIDNNSLPPLCRLTRVRHPPTYL